MPLFTDPEPLSAEHDLDVFDCGVDSLNTWLQRYARAAAGAGSAKTFVTTDSAQGERVVGYHALTVASVEHAHAVDRATKGMPKHPIPCVLLAQLAVDRSVQGQGLGAWLLRDATIRTLAAAEEVGIRAVLVHAIDESAVGFYRRHGFEPSPTDPHNLQLLIEDIRRSAESADYG